jgi:hypothetical protein
MSLLSHPHSILISHTKMDPPRPYSPTDPSPDYNPTHDRPPLVGWQTAPDQPPAPAPGWCYVVILEGYGFERLVRVSLDGWDFLNWDPQTAAELRAADGTRAWVHDKIRAVGEGTDKPVEKFELGTCVIRRGAEEEYARDYVDKDEEVEEDAERRKRYPGGNRRSERVHMDWPNYRAHISRLRFLAGEERIDDGEESTPAALNSIKGWLRDEWDKNFKDVEGEPKCRTCEKKLVLPANVGQTNIPAGFENPGVLPCGHILGAGCLLKWVETIWNTPCPVCGETVLADVQEPKKGDIVETLLGDIVYSGEGNGLY